MSEIDALPADQRAALQLLLKQGQSYDQLADLLGIDASGVRGRAHAALDAVGPASGARLSAGDRAQVADYLLGQQSLSRREATRDLLAESGDAREWAAGVADVLRPLAGDALPEVPSAAAVVPPPHREPPAPPREREERAPFDEGDEPAAFDIPPREPRRPRTRRDGAGGPSSRLGGALLLAGVGIVIAVVLVLLINGGDDGKKGSTVSKTAPTQTSTSAQRPIAQINLFSATGNSKQVGLAQVFAQSGKRALIVAGQGLSPGAYALWLYNSKSDARLLGFVPERVGQTGRFATQGELPTDAERYKQLVVTQEQVTRQTKTPPKVPGTIVLRGDLKLR
jgi:hypothetical protein